jgi:transcriptional regulator with XRE-family HTH domain
MDEHGLRRLIDDVRGGRLQRRSFVQMMVGLGLGAPLAAQMLAFAGIARAQSPATSFTPTRRGGGGPLKTLWWQAPTLLNPHFATGTKDQDASRIFYEPLAGFDPDGNITPILASEVPSVPAGTLARDLMWVVWRLKKSVSWHDGKPFTADDVAFTYEYASDPATAAVTSGSYREVSRVEKVDSHTVRVVFAKPQPFWADAFCGNRGMIVPRHLFEPFKGDKSREAPTNLKPVGTGPYRFVDFKAGDTVRGELFPGHVRIRRHIKPSRQRRAYQTLTRLAAASPRRTPAEGPVVSRNGNARPYFLTPPAEFSAPAVPRTLIDRSRHGCGRTAFGSGRPRARTARLTRGLTQALVAEKAGIAREHLLRIEAGTVDPSVGTVAHIARALHVPLFTLLSSGRNRRVAPDSRQIELALVARFRRAQRAKRTYVEVKAGDLHRDIADPSDPAMNRTPLVCHVMTKHRTSHDRVVSQPPKGKGLMFTVRYQLPRPSHS